MEVQGTIKVIGETKTFGDNGFRKREIVVKTDEQYPQEILIEVTKDRCDALNGYNVGDNVKVNVNIKGRSWTNPEGVVKYFVSIEGWRIEKVGGSTEPTPQAPAQDDDSGLPF